MNHPPDPYRTALPVPKLKPYSGKLTECVKCGNQGASSHYDSEANVIARECHNCDYEWNERPLDTP